MKALKKFYYQLCSWRAANNRLPLDIDFSTAGFVAGLRKAPALPQSLQAALSATDDEQALSGVRAYFITRKTPILFHSREKMATLVERVAARFPQWQDRTLKQVEKDIQKGLRSYGVIGPPMSGDYPWAGTLDVPGQDLQYRKKPHRFSFLPRMALASLYEPTLTARLLEILKSWTAFAESEQGGPLAYDSSLAVIQRLLATTWSWLYLISAPDSEREQSAALQSLLLRIIFADIRFLAPRLGQSYGNNHLLADYFAGWFISQLFPEFARASSLQGDYQQRWSQELLRQTYCDGWTFEHSIHYHEFACDMGLCYLLLCRCNEWPVEPAVEHRIRQMLRLQAEVAGVEGIPIRLGDCIEDNFSPLGVHEGLAPLLYREIYRGLFDPDIAPANPARPEVEVAYWLLGGLATESNPGTSSAVTAFEQGGLYCLADDQQQMRLLFRTGPATSETICAGHAHADWLTIYLIAEGEPVIVDSGTYSYRSNPAKWPAGEPAWRAYFLAPESHNGVVIEGLDPLGIAEGDFRPKLIDARVKSRLHADTPVVSWVDAGFENVARLQGYVRGVVMIPGYYTLVYDNQPLEANLDWAGLQFSPTTQVVKAAGGQGLKLGPVDLWLSQGITDTKLFSGSLHPLAGWVSNRYGVLEKAPQARFGFDPTIRQTAMLLTKSSEAAYSIETDRLDALRVFTIRSGNQIDSLILSAEVNYTATDYAGVHFDAGLLWWRRVADRLIQLVATDVQLIRIGRQMQFHFQEREPWIRVDLTGNDPVVHTASGNSPRIVLE